MTEPFTLMMRATKYYKLIDDEFNECYQNKNLDLTTKDFFIYNHESQARFY